MLRYMYVTNNLGSVVLTVLRVTVPKTMFKANATIQLETFTLVKITIVRGWEGGGGQRGRNA